MSDLACIYLREPKAAHLAWIALWRTAREQLEAGRRLEVVLRDPARSSPQNRKLHAMFGDVARSCLWQGQPVAADDWKRLLVDAFRRATIADPEMAELWARAGRLRTVPSLDGQGVVTLGLQTRDFPSALASALIEWLYAWGAEAGVTWSDEGAA